MPIILAALLITYGLVQLYAVKKIGSATGVCTKVSKWLPGAFALLAGGGFIVAVALRGSPGSNAATDAAFALVALAVLLRLKRPSGERHP